MKSFTFDNKPASIDGAPVILEGKPANFEWFLRAVLRTDVQFNTDWQGGKAALAIEKALDEALSVGVKQDDAGKVLEHEIHIEDSHWERLCVAMKTPQSARVIGYPITPASLCIPWADLILEAK